MYKKKAIINRSYVEVYDWRFLVGEPILRSNRPKIKRMASGSDRKRRIDSLNRSVRLFKRYFDNNYEKFSTNSWWLTLTFADNVKDHRQASKSLASFFRRLSVFFGNGVSYLGVLEYQKRGAIHYHFVVAGLGDRYVDYNLVRKIWGQGRIHLKPIYDYGDALSSYLCNYLHKSAVCPFGFRWIFRSKNLVGWKEIFDEEVENFLYVVSDQCLKVFECFFYIHEIRNNCCLGLYKFFENIGVVLSRVEFSTAPPGKLGLFGI